MSSCIKSNRGSSYTIRTSKEMKHDGAIPRITDVIHRIHALAGMTMLYWWELHHLYAFLFPGK